MANKLNVTIGDIEKELKFNTVRSPLKRKCGVCGRGYFRRNRVEQWTGRNIGKRYGWHKDISNICLECMSEAESRRIVGMAEVTFGKLVRIGKRI